jgi:dynein heavy chain 1
VQCQFILFIFIKVRHLKTMGFRIPMSVLNKAHKANALYPYAVCLLDSVRTYETVNERVASKREIELLLAGMKREVQNAISEVRFIAL